MIVLKLELEYPTQASHSDQVLFHSTTSQAVSLSRAIPLAVMTSRSSLVSYSTTVIIYSSTACNNEPLVNVKCAPLRSEFMVSDMNVSAFLTVTAFNMLLFMSAIKCGPKC